ncbi:MAG: cysteine desulfurase [Candidatus Dadabacteria bacterium]|nr:MAG: cysteine desulfurase [Candidatus Dadabacteria bacterium]
MRLKKPVNFDCNATRGPLAEVLEEISSCYGSFFNPSSVHSGGQAARALIEDTRDLIREHLRIDNSYRIIFTSGATESNNTAIMSAYLANPPENNGFVATAIEHSSVVEPLKRLSRLGADVTFIKPENNFEITVERVLECCNKKTRFVSIMAANNETGQLIDTNRIFKELRLRFPEITLHSDCVQLAGKSLETITSSGADLYSLSGHKLGALSGIGLLLVSKDYSLEPLLCGGPHEEKLRAGTENVCGIVSFAAAIKRFYSDPEGRIIRMREYRDRIWSTLRDNFNDLSLNYSSERMLPNTISVHIPGVLASDLVVALDLEGVLISAGSACSSGKPEGSHVLKEMGYDDRHTRESVRISTADWYEPELFDAALEKLIECIRRMRC